MDNVVEYITTNATTLAYKRQREPAKGGRQN